MTCICAIELCAKYEMSLSTTYFKVTEWSADINGTSANLIANSWVSIMDLLYGLMLPSGNDAALVLA
jgi:D-alanyl-D-alanine carboxypeptidase